MEIVVITSKTCPPCKALKERLKADNIPFSEIDVINVDYEKLEIRSVPVMLLENESEVIDRMNGFNLPDYKRIIERIK